LNFNIDINALYTAQFGLNASIGTRAVIDKVFNQAGNIAVLPTDQPFEEVRTYMGTPVWDYIILQADRTGDEVFEGLNFPLECTTEASIGKKIVETDIVGRDGVIEELIGLSDWQLTVKGFFINYESTDYPTDQVKAFREAFAYKGTDIPVVSTFLNLLGVNFVSLKSLNLPAMYGYSNVQPFECQMISKRPFDIEVEF
jgi:hypothetical protein